MPHELEPIWRRVDDLGARVESTDRELAVLTQRTEAQERRTEKLMGDVAEGRAEFKQCMTEISSNLGVIKSWQDRHDGKLEGRDSAGEMVRWFIPVLITVAALGRTIGWW